MNSSSTTTSAATVVTGAAATIVNNNNNQDVSNNNNNNNFNHVPINSGGGGGSNGRRRTHIVLRRSFISTSAPSPRNNNNTSNSNSNTDVDESDHSNVSEPTVSETISSAEASMNVSLASSPIAGNNSDGASDDPDLEGHEKPSWIDELHHAWEEEIHTNMSSDKQGFFLSFNDSEEDDDDDEEGPKRNRRIRRHMKHFIETEQAKSEHIDVHHAYFFAPTVSSTTPDDNNDEQKVVSEDPPSNTLVSLTNSIIISDLKEKSSTTTTTTTATTPVPQKKSLLQRLFNPTVSNITTTPTNLNTWIVELQKYEQRLLGFIRDCKIVIRDMKSKEQVERLFVYKELLFLKECRLYSVVRPFRKYYILRIMELQRRLKLEIDIKRVLKSRLNDTREALSLLKAAPGSSDYKSILPENLTRESYYFLSADQILTGTPEFAARRTVIRQLDVLYKRAEKDYINIRKASGANKKVRPKREQQTALKRIVDQFIMPNCDQYSKPVSWRAFLDIIADEERSKLQREFNSLIGDSRSQEGQSIRTFVNELHNVGFGRVPPGEIVEYAASFVTYIAKLNGLITGKNTEKDMQVTKVLSYLVHQYIFGEVIVKDLERLENVRNEYDNKHFCTQQIIVANLEPTQLGVAQKFLPLQPSAIADEEHMVKQNAIQSIYDQPYANPIDILSFLGLCTTPADMLNCVHMCAKQIHHIARCQCDLKGKDFTFGADEFFPLLVYVVSRAVLPTIHTNLALMAKYISESEKDERPEVVYYLTCLEGAVMYVSGLTESDVRNLTTEALEEEKSAASAQSVTSTADDKQAVSLNV